MIFSFFRNKFLKREFEAEETEKKKVVVFLQEEKKVRE